MAYHFLENKFGPHFCQPEITKIKKLINSSVSFTVAGMPGVGVTIFLKYLAATKFAHFLYVDSYLLTNLTKEEFFKLLLRELGEESLNDEYLFERCLYKLEDLTRKYPKVVLIFNRFDQLQSIFDKTFFSNIWALRNVNPEKIIIISTANHSLAEIAAESLIEGNKGVFSRVVYLKPYSLKDLRIITSTYIKSNLIEEPTALKLATGLCGGHHQLLQLLLKSARLSNPLQDRFIELQLKELYEFVNYRQRGILRKIARGKEISPKSLGIEYLVEIGLIKRSGKKIEIFSPLLTRYITHHHPGRLPVKEAKLFNLLKLNFGQVVSKKEIFHIFWPDVKEFDKTKEWALNSLIYRLKKNPTFLSFGYIIESHKKVGYVLFKN